MKSPQLTTPSPQDRKVASENYEKLADVLNKINHPENVPEIVIRETDEQIKIPFAALKMLAFILKQYKEGNAVSVVPIAAEFTTQKAADFLNCSRPHIIKLINENKLAATLVGRHRRIKFKDLKTYKEKMIKDREIELVKLMEESEELGMYDS